MHPIGRTMQEMDGQLSAAFRQDRFIQVPNDARSRAKGENVGASVKKAPPRGRLQALLQELTSAVAKLSGAPCDYQTQLWLVRTRQYDRCPG